MVSENEIRMTNHRNVAADESGDEKIDNVQSLLVYSVLEFISCNSTSWGKVASEATHEIAFLH